VRCLRQQEDRHLLVRLIDYTKILQLVVTALCFMHPIRVAAAETPDCNTLKELLKTCDPPQEVRDAVCAIFNFKSGTLKESAGSPQLRDVARSRLLSVVLSKPADVLCERNPVDRLVAHDKFGKQTLLTAAVMTGDFKLIDTVEQVVSNNKGNIFARNGDSKIANELASSLRPANLEEQKVLNKLLPPLDAMNNPQFWDRLGTAGNPGPVQPEVDYSPTRVPPYVTNLIQAQQGVSIGSKEVDGTNSPSVQGELRYILHSHSDWEGETANRFFLFAGGNLNKNKDPTNPTSPNWWSTGLGYKHLHNIQTALNAFGFQRSQDTEYGWAEAIVKIGYMQNRVPIDNQKFGVVNFAESLFFPLWLQSENGRPLYGAVTGGIRLQKQDGGDGQTTPTNYKFERLDIYVYPCWIWSRCPKFFEDHELKSSTVTLHLDRQVVNNSGGKLNEFQLSWAFRPNQSLSITRSFGNQDPITSFGIPLKSTIQNQVQIKIQN
jgi:hypothetical protein